MCFEKENTDDGEDIANIQTVVILEKEVKSALKMFIVNKGKSCPDDIPSSFIRICAQTLTTPLTMIFNISERFM